ncbi:hypothetical protein EYC84_005068 [Monilinia fructicola]|uniref:BRCT domain-containing protein n=1 Tax=Monilinia fructicola TaxID=38448 RepID=A0A5M9JYC5_MONFR|nr:hypothetical protein EYC84_005068 [Monilinia fructicola]
MFRTREKAEQVAEDVERTQEFDTQQCRELQEAIISSSNSEKPAAGSNTPTPTVASGSFLVHATDNHSYNGRARSISNDIQAARASNNIDYTISEQNSDPAYQIKQTNDGLPLIFNSTSSNSVSCTLKRKRDNENKLRPIKSNGPQHPHTKTARLREMSEEELTQKSNLSPTQENSASIYEAFESHRSRDQDVEGSGVEFSSSPPIAIQQDDLPELQSQNMSGDPSKLSNSTHTGWTARTYEENDTGHIDFDGFQPTSGPDEHYFESQDPLVAPATRDSTQEHHFQPETPAPSVNPFSDKGSVMKQHELFGATQPSSIGKLGGSPTSSRPSPDAYDGFRYSQEEEPSPLVGRSEIVNGISQGAVRSLLRSISVETPVSLTPTRVLAKATSFNSGLRKPAFIPEPQDHYISMKESQERRRMLRNTGVSSGSESDSDVEPMSKKQKRAEIDKRVREDMNKVTLRRPSSSVRPSSAKDGKPIPAAAIIPPRPRNHQRTSSELTSSHSPQASESTPTTVEVPASGRRRSRQEDYVTQCEDFDARDTQPTQQDIIADSQGAPVSSNLVASSPVPGPRKNPLTSIAFVKSDAEPISQSQGLPKQVQQPASLEKTLISDGSIINEVEKSKRRGSDGPNLTNQDRGLLSNEGFIKSKIVMAPVAQMQGMLSDGVASSIPETSPATDRLKPMTEIADVSFSVLNDDQFDDLPGFTEDTEFNEAMGLSNEEITNRQLQFHPPVATAPNPIALGPDDSAAPVSSGLSSAPSILDPPTPAAEYPMTPLVRQGSETESVERNSREAEQSTEPSELSPLMHAPKADMEKNLSSAATTEGNVESHQRVLTDEPQLPLPKTQRRKSSRVSTSQVKKQISSPKTQKKPVRNTRLSSVCSTTSTSVLSTDEPHLTSTSNSNSNRKSHLKQNGAATSSETMDETPLPASKRGRPRKSTTPCEKLANTMVPLSKKKSGLPLDEESEDPLALSSPRPKAALHSRKSSDKLFSDMAFAVSYVGAEKDKDHAARLIKQHGGRILEDGFESLFTISSSKSRTEEREVGETDLEIASSAANVGFVALIADEHSRKTKYMQALALGFPCISGRWISDCVKRGTITDWLPYLLCAGHSTFLGGAMKSRYLRPYPATDATLNNTFAERSKLLRGKSILIVTGKGKAGEKRKPYTFLTQALGPTRLGQAQDLNQAREMLLDAESRESSYDWLYMDGKPDAEATVFEGTPIGAAKGQRKRKRASNMGDDVTTPLPKRIRVINDEIIIQSLILGQLIEE